jgi:glycosyltransferase involved in cell wall biosynthesis
MLHKRSIAICSYFKSEIARPAEIALFDGDNSVGGFFRALKAASKDADYDVIHVHSPYTGVFVLAGLVTNGLYRKLMPSAVYTVQNSYQNYKFSNRLMLIPILACYPTIVFCSNACRESMPFFLRWFARNKAHVVQNAVDIGRVDRAMASASNNNGDAQFTIASVGRLTGIKNPFCLLKAFEQSNEGSSKLVFIGEGDLRARLTAETQKLGLEQQVELTGLVGRDQVFEYLAAADIFVSVSRGEGLPVAVLEAMACRRPVILSDIPPHREITNGTSFIPLIPPNDVAGFAREIAHFKQMPASKRADIGERCRKLVEDRFDLASMHKAYEEVYAQVVGLGKTARLR